MPEIDAMVAGRKATASFPAIVDPSFLAPFRIGMAVYRYCLGMTSRLLQDQCAHLQNLAECDDLLDMMVYQVEFGEKFVAAVFVEQRGYIDEIIATAYGHLTTGRAIPE